MIIEKYREYFRTIATYHRADVAKRPQLLAGYVLAISTSHADEFTRQAVAKFYAKEAMKHGTKPASA